MNRIEIPKRIAQLRKAYEYSTFCPIIKSNCDTNCISYAHPTIYEEQYYDALLYDDLKDGIEYEVEDGYCSCPQLTRKS